MPKTSRVQKTKLLLPPPAPIKVYSFEEFEKYQEEERIRNKVNALAYPKKKISFS